MREKGKSVIGLQGINVARRKRANRWRASPSNPIVRGADGTPWGEGKLPGTALLALPRVRIAAPLNARLAINEEVVTSLGGERRTGAGRGGTGGVANGAEGGGEEGGKKGSAALSGWKLLTVRRAAN